MHHLNWSISLVLVCVFFAQVPSQKDWRGLAPLKSNRADVERLLGKADVNFENQLLTYHLSDSIVSFQFTGNPGCAKELNYSSWNVPAETLTAIKVRLKQQMLSINSGIDFSKLKKVKGDPDLPGHYYYSDTESGFSIEVGDRFILGYVYEPEPKKTNLRCPIKVNP